MTTQRLQKVMAEAGIASRRHCEEMILDGEVKVNGAVVTRLPVLVDPAFDHIVVAGRKLRAQAKLYYLLNKPRKVVCTNSDPQGRRRAIDMLPSNVKQRLYTVGRLDTDSQGLVILTNDGELANQLTHPRFGVTKTYQAEITGQLEAKDIARLRKGLHLPQGKAAMESVKVVHRGPQQSHVEITLREGRNRQIRIMLARLGHSVRRLTRVRIGPLTLSGLGPGKVRLLTGAEVRKLRRLADPERVDAGEDEAPTKRTVIDRRAATSKRVVSRKRTATGKRAVSGKRTATSKRGVASKRKTATKRATASKRTVAAKRTGTSKRKVTARAGKKRSR